MQFGLFGSAAARRGSPEFDSSEGFRDFIEYNIEAEALRDLGVGYVLLNGGGSGGGARGRESLRRFARDIMPLFDEAAPHPVRG